MCLADPREHDVWDDEEDVCEECQREREAEELLEEMERAAIVSISFEAFG